MSTFGEVIKVIYDDKNPETIYGIEARIHSPHPSALKSLVTAIPLTSSLIKMPIVGEIVELFLAPSPKSNGLSQSPMYYYTNIIGLQSSVHHNSIPTVTEVGYQSGKYTGNPEQYSESSTGNSNTNTRSPNLDEDFDENPNVKPLQPYIGDIIYQGRYGQSLRFSTTSRNISPYTIKPKFHGSIGRPITILKNTTQSKSTNKFNDFVSEDFNNEENVIVIASGQELEFTQSSGILSAIRKANITSWDSEKWGNTPQTLISSGRIILNSTRKEIMAFAKEGIGLSSATSVAIDSKEKIIANSKKIELGADANEPLILGNKWKQWMNNFVNTLGTLSVVTPSGPSSPLSASPQWVMIKTMMTQLDMLLSEVAFTKKLAIVTESPGILSTLILPDPVFTIAPEKVFELEQEKEEVANEIENNTLIYSDRELATMRDVHNRIVQETALYKKDSDIIPTDMHIAAEGDVSGSSLMNIDTGSLSIDDLGNVYQVVYNISGSEYKGQQLKGVPVKYEQTLPQDIIEWDTDETVDFFLIDAQLDYIKNGYKPNQTVYKSQEEIDSDTKDIGLKIAKSSFQMVKDGVKEDPPGSNMGIYINNFYNSVGCEPGKPGMSWHAAFVSYQFALAGVNIPLDSQEYYFSSVQGLVDWAQATNRWASTPIPGAAIVYGITEGATSATSGTMAPTNIGIVVSIDSKIDNSDPNNPVTTVNNLICAQKNSEGTDLIFSQPNMSYVLGYIIPLRNDGDAPGSFKPDADIYTTDIDIKIVPESLIIDKMQTGYKYVQNSTIKYIVLHHSAGEGPVGQFFESYLKNAAPGTYNAGTTQYYIDNHMTGTYGYGDTSMYDGRIHQILDYSPGKVCPIHSSVSWHEYTVAVEVVGFGNGIKEKTPGVFHYWEQRPIYNAKGEITGWTDVWGRKLKPEEVITYDPEVVKNWSAYGVNESQKYSARYSDKQIQALYWWIVKMCRDYNIPCNGGLPKLIANDPDHGQNAFNICFQGSNPPEPGIYCHSNFATDRFDMMPQPELLSMLVSLHKRPPTGLIIS